MAPPKYVPQYKQQIAHTCPADHVLYGGAAGGGKLLNLDTLVPTPTGWTTMGDLQTGDELFDENGAICRVVVAHPIEQEPVSYRLTFDDGSQIEACEDHEWLTYTADDLLALTKRTDEYRARRRERRPSRVAGRKSEAFTATISARNRVMTPPTFDPPTGTIKTTGEIAATLYTPRGRKNHAILVTAPIQLPDRELPLDPYLFGLWLGDGSTTTGVMTTADDEITEAFRAAGFRVAHYGKYQYGINGLVTILRSMGVIGNKHVPTEYLRASAGQRLALLQGLMDTDGTACDSGSVEFTTTKLRLALGVQELAASLGHKAVIRTGRATLYGKDCGPKYRIKWTPPEYVFRLPRKIERQQPSVRRTTKFRYIVSCERIDPVPMRCITVDSPSSLYLVGSSFIPTHNSRYSLEEAIATVREEPGAVVILFRRTYPELEKMIRESRAAIDPKEASYRASSYLWEFKNADKSPTGIGSVLRFGHMHQLQDMYRYQSDEFDLIIFDEGGLFEAAMIVFMHSRNRTALPNGWPRLRITANPGNIGHKYMLDTFVRPAGEHTLIAYWNFETHQWTLYPAGTRGKPKPYVVWKPDPSEEHLALGIEPKTRCFIPATVQDNKYIDAGYVASLMELPEDKKNALLYGDWDTYEGQFFSEFKEATHVIDPISPPAHWRKWRALDHGYYDPLACLWMTQNPETGQIIAYRELYQTNLTDTEACNLIKSMTPADEHIDFTVADKAMWRGSSNDRMMNTAMVYGQNGIHLMPANTDRIAGWSRMRDLLATNPEQGQPGLVFTRNCTHTIESLPTLVHSETNPEDLHDKHADSHCADACRYGIMSRGTVMTRRSTPIKAGKFR